MRDFATYSEALAEGKRVVDDIGKGRARKLSHVEENDAVTAFERLRQFYTKTGREISLTGAVNQFAEAAAQLSGMTLSEAVGGYLRTVASVKRKRISEAVEEFLTTLNVRTKAKDGQRAALTTHYTDLMAGRLHCFSNMFKNYDVCDVSAEHIDKFIGSLGDFASKTRNHYRVAVGQFLRWSTRKDFLTQTHRLFEADGLKIEPANGAEIGIYTHRDLAALLETADNAMRPLVAIGAFCGLRTAELLRLTWEDVWRVANHVEVTALKSKTRQRRLVEMPAALHQWLEPYRQHTTGKLWDTRENLYQKRFAALAKRADVRRVKNGLRHSYCSFHFALHQNENATAQQAGNSPGMIHSAYKGLTTKTEAERWFNVVPPEGAKNVIALPNKML
jgi:integrase